MAADMKKRTEIMQLDKTFCTGLRCSRANTCERWLENLKKWAVAHGCASRINVVSIAQFDDGAGKCYAYIPLEEELP